MTAETTTPDLQVIAKAGLPVFLVREGQKAGYVAHTSNIKQRRAIRELLSKAWNAPVKVVAHDWDKIDNARSLAHLTARFGEGQIHYDPTGIVGRSEALVRLSQRLRDLIDSQIGGLYLEAERRTLFVVLDRSKFAEGSEHTSPLVVEAMNAVTECCNAWRTDDHGAIDVVVRVGFHAPEGAKLVSVDKASAPDTVLERMRRPQGIRAMIAGTGLLFSQTAMADGPRNPAVKAPNATAESRLGVVDDDFWYGGQVKGTLPLGDWFGFQAEGGFGNHNYKGGAGHLFFRNTDVALLGITGSYETYRGVEMGRIGAEAELYFDLLHLSGKVGYQLGDVEHSAFGRLDVRFYPDDNFELNAGVELSDQIKFGRAGAEWQPMGEMAPALSIYADSEFNADGFDAATAGIRIHFGTNRASLKERKRTYDPVSGLFNFSTLAAAVNDLRKQYGAGEGGEGGEKSID